MGGYDRARKAAAAAVMRLHGGHWAAEAAEALAVPSLTQRDRAFAGAVFWGTAERLWTLDYLLAPLVKKPLEKLDAPVRALLESGLYQLLYMRVPAAAAVDESVKLVRAFGKTSAAGLVNAVLRKAAGLYAPAQPGAGPNFARLALEDERLRVCVTYSVAPAVADAVMEALPGEYDAYFAAGFSNGELCLRVNTLRITAEEMQKRLENQGVEVCGGPLPGSLYARLPGGVVGEACFEAGLYHVQGAASQTACACVAARPGWKVLDTCAAPGGKSATLAQAMGGGAGLTSCDVNPDRLERVGQALGRLKIEGARVLQQDATVYDPRFEGQDAVLCDVPCSGLGVLGQKPDLRTAGGGNFAALPGLQMKVLSVAARYVKKGGRLVYSTCTIRPRENGDVVRAFLSQNPGFVRVPPPVCPAGAMLEDDMMTLLPNRTGFDGFFVAVMEKI